MDMYEMLSSRATYVIGLQLICASRNASRLNLAVLVFCTFAMIFALRLELYTLSFQSSTKVGQGHIAVATLVEQFPQEATLIVSQYRAYLTARKEQRITRTCEAVRQAVFILYEQRIDPSYER